MKNPEAGIDAELLSLVDRFLGRSRAPARLVESRHVRVSLRGTTGERMIGRDGHELGAEERVRPGGVDLEVLSRADGPIDIKLEPDPQALRAADPVALHQPHLVRPARQRLKPVVQILGEFGDLEEPLREFARLDDGTRAPSSAVDHLLVGQHGVVDGIPVDPRRLASDQVCSKKIQEQTLLVLVIGRVARRKLTRPVQ